MVWNSTVVRPAAWVTMLGSTTTTVSFAKDDEVAALDKSWDEVFVVEEAGRESISLSGYGEPSTRSPGVVAFDTRSISSVDTAEQESKL